ncbi:Hypothetical predicted protein [Xyrichtys novacula]|uniref:Uncharacterized protein n=1 Tax=Xyrichtys novacula TaxID=13765 RepID=A0AAV1FYP3_XYRNO|nr:Hypothetical predicted protein [Xyrichtys novacula]
MEVLWRCPEVNLMRAGIHMGNQGHPERRAQDCRPPVCPAESSRLLKDPPARGRAPREPAMQPGETKRPPEPSESDSVSPGMISSLL